GRHQNNASLSWYRLGVWSFRLHSTAIIGIVAVLFAMLYYHRFEYHYVWQHSNTEMPLKFIFSCFWEGQEGSFLLWAFWHVVLGNLLLLRRNKYTSVVMSVFASVQVFLVSMLLGVYFGEYRLGSNPFTVMLREHPDFMGLPMFNNSDYLLNLDGRGLNPLLQNYWMTIHPPTLFLGFASVLIPFSYAIAGLVLRDFRDWIRPALPWTYFSLMALGAGILMGGAWAYEALSFGGFWAWDPVENASLVPWITLAGGAHLMMLQQRGKNSLLSMYLLITLSFILVLYSTFLTRSGVLGEASVHSFTDLGMSGQLLVYLLFYLVLSVVLIAKSTPHFRTPAKEEELLSREFWMFVGALVLFLSAFQITLSTSIPVINKVFGTKLAPPADAIAHYNGWQEPLAIIILILMGFAQLLKYKNTPRRSFFKTLIIPFIAAALLSTATVLWLRMYHPFHVALLFAGVFAFFGNVHYFIKIIHGKLPRAGGAITHTGFALLITGALISMATQHKISKNASIYDVNQLGKEFNNNENILLMQGDTLQMGTYWVVYSGKEKQGVNLYFNVEYLQKNPSGKMFHAFTLRPRVQLNPRMGNVAEPDTRHFLDKDIYTHVTWAILEDNQDEDDYAEPQIKTIRPGDTIFTSSTFIVADSLFRVNDVAELGLSNEDVVVGLPLKMYNSTGAQSWLKPIYILRDSTEIISIPSEQEEAGIKVIIQQIHPENGTIDIKLSEKKSMQRDFIVMQAVVFPYINLLWIGCIVMLFGLGTSIYYRIKFNKK
ncbi:MAG: cytochrome c biogenesis protein CcsA, partial [Flavobacteriales bacterium]|nr:cytochrome c biogenesis protein CcsA [Flavobacteriales bacterium]